MAERVENCIKNESTRTYTHACFGINITLILPLILSLVLSPSFDEKEKVPGM